MHKRDWSLVFFTTLSQWGVGIVLCLAVLGIYPGSATLAAPTGISLANPALLALVLVGAATTVSFLHLGNPVNAPGALRNLATSWLSREILAIGLFSLSLLAVVAHGWRTGAQEFSVSLLILASIAGLLLLWTMARVYRIPTVPAWDSGHTPLAFLCTALSLGLAGWLVFGASGLLELEIETARGLATGLLAVLVLEGISGILNQHRLARMDTGFDGPDFRGGAFPTVHRARMAVLLLACLGAAIMIYLHDPLQSSWPYPVLALVILQEIAARFLFYASYFRIGM